MEKSCGVFFLSWPEAFQAGAAAAGGKGWNLGRLERYGFKVPAGGVLAAGVYQRFIEENNLVEEIRKITRSATIDNVGKKEIEKRLFSIREKIRAGHIPGHIQEELISSLKSIGILEKPLAVRSSATAEDSGKASFAGIHESFLNVIGQNNILSAIKGCFASLWTPPAVAYRRKMNIKDDEVIQAVVIMEMVEAEAAGVGFTCDPRTGREDMVLISANFGLGESVVSGAVEPDQYCLDYWGEIAEKKIGFKEGKTVAGKDGGTEFVRSAVSSTIQALSDESICKLGSLIHRVFDSLGQGEQHQDIEWVFDGKEFTLVQARPVTVLPRYTFDELKNQPDLWSNANVSDNMPMVLSTLTWSIYKRLFKITGVFDYEIPPGLQCVRLYQGRVYVNLSIQQWCMYDAFGFPPHQSNEAWGGHQPEIEISEKNPYRGIKGCKRLWRLLRLIILGAKIRKNAPNAFDNVDLFSRALLKKDLKSIAEKDLINKFAEIKSAYLNYYPVFISCAATADTSLLVKALEKYFPGKGKVYANALMAGGGEIPSAQQGYRLVEMAQIAREDATARSFFSARPFHPLQWEKELPEESPFKQLFRSFLAEYGHRAVYESEIMSPRWREDPSYILNVIKSTMETADMSKIRARQKEKVDGVWREIRRKVPAYRRRAISKLLKQSLKSMELREMSKSVLIKINESYRIVCRETGRRLAEKGILEDEADIFHCSCSEIFSILQGFWDGKGLDILVFDRKIRREEMEILSPPNFIVDEVPKFTETVTSGSGNVITGLGVATGKAGGTARLIYHPHQGEKLQTGNVLVAPTTDPGWTPLFLRASAIVVETGGVGSHGAIVAREYGIPTVVNVPGAMKVIRDGREIVVDGDEGKILLL